jgi:N6-adenosine-specific RNA methylase IME4
LDLISASLGFYFQASVFHGKIFYEAMRGIDLYFDVDYDSHIMTPNDNITGYSIYNNDARKRTKHNTLAELYPALPNKRYDIIYADPPWDYNGKMQFDRTSTTKEKLDLTRKIFISSATFKYPTLKLDELKKLPIHSIMKDDCLLFMWATSPHLENAIKLGIAWGFQYKTIAFIWNKMIHNPGQYTLSNCELCLVFKHGKIPHPRGARNVQQLVSVPRQGHSVKPIEVMNGIKAMFPTQNKLEMFARRNVSGWDSWGLDFLYDPENFKLEQDRA